MVRASRWLLSVIVLTLGIYPSHAQTPDLLPVLKRESPWSVVRSPGQVDGLLRTTDHGLRTRQDFAQRCEGNLGDLLGIGAPKCRVHQFE